MLLKRWGLSPHYPPGTHFWIHPVFRDGWNLWQVRNWYWMPPSGSPWPDPPPYPDRARVRPQDVAGGAGNLSCPE